MGGQDTGLFRLAYLTLTGPVKLTPRLTGRRQRINDGSRVVHPNRKPFHYLFQHRHRPGLVQVSQRTSGQFRDPLPNEYTLRVMILGLLDGIVDPDRIGTRHARLHLKLGVVDTRLEIRVQPGQMPTPFLPMLKQVMR
jgi:hypothetical protein